MLTKFKLWVVLHIAGLLVIMAIGLYVSRDPNSAPILVALVTAFGIIIWSLFRLVNKTNRHLANFLMGIKYDDFATNYSSMQQEKSEEALYGAFNMITGKFRDIRLEKEIQFQYFQSLVEQVDTGLIGFDDTGKTIFMNRALKSLIHKSHFPSLSAITRFDAELHSILTDLRPGERQMLKRNFGQKPIELAIQKTQLNLKGKKYVFFSFQNIHEELQEQEVQSWHKLIRILTHEIMNSVSPVVSLAHSTHDLLSKEAEFTDEMRDDLRMAVGAIHKRSEGLLHFTSAYRKLTKLPQPQMQDLEAKEFLTGIIVLLEPQLSKQGVQLNKEFSAGSLNFRGDPELLEQVFINLIKNAAEAVVLSDEKRVTLGVEKSDVTITFTVADSGPGIADDVLEQIFVPFFTTKDTGSGIGLSLCRQIIQSHDGSISAYSNEGQGAVFTVSLPISQDI